MHYGVLGMKWGVRRNPDKAYNKATVKKQKLISNVDKTRQAYDQAKINVNSGASSKYQKYQAKATALKIKSDKAEAKKLKRSIHLIGTEDTRYQKAARKADKAKAKYMKVQTKANKYKAKYEKSTLELGIAEAKHLKAVTKAEKWVEQMNKTFKDIDVKSLDSNKVDSGKSFLEEMKDKN